MTKIEFGRNPGRSKGKALVGLKGRQAKSKDIASVRALLGQTPCDASLLIEYLHALQDNFGQITLNHLAALAEILRLSQAEVYEVATFYHAFHVTDEDEIKAKEVTIHVCDSLVCAMAGADKLAIELQSSLSETVRVERTACLGRCECAPSVGIGRQYVDQANLAKVKAALKTPTQAGDSDNYISFSDYKNSGGYELLANCINNLKDREDVVTAIDDSNLRGLGGAGFPAGRKWRFVRAEPNPRYLVVNGDESEPGTFKDRFYLETNPHQFIEGMLIAAWAIEAVEIYLYIRNEYPHLRAILECELKHVEAAGFLHCPVIFRRGAGAYICGEESALLESLEGKRGLPRHKPPFPAQIGLFGQPTLINNLETLYWVPDAIRDGASWQIGPDEKQKNGLRSYSVSGRVRLPGVKLAPAGITVRELIDKHCGGMADGHTFQAYLPGGASGGVLPARLDDVPLDFGTLEEYGGLIGSAAVIVLSQADDIKFVVKNLLHFFAEESCGQCTPCRVGTEKAVTLMAEKNWDIDLLDDIANVMADGSICGLGQAAANPIHCAIRYFREDIA